MHIGGQGIPHDPLFPCSSPVCMALSSSDYLICSLVFTVAKPKSPVFLSVLVTTLSVTVQWGSQSTVFECVLCPSSCIPIASGLGSTFSVFCDSAP